MSEVENIIDQLKAYKKRYYLNKLLKGSILCLAIMLSFFLVINSLEYFMRFPKEVRTAIFFSGTAFSFLVLLKYVVRPLMALMDNNRQLSNEEAAKQIGNYFPEISDKLLNIIQLSNLGQTDNSLIIASIKQKSNQISWIPITASIKLSDNRRYLKYLLPPFAIGLILLLLLPQFYTEATKRLVYYDKDFVPESPFKFLVNSSLTAYRNEDFALNVNLEGSALPSEVFMISQNRKIKLEKTSKTSFSYTFLKLQQKQEFYLEAAGWKSDSYNLEVFERPDISRININFEYPTYLQKKSESISNTGSISVPEGTKVSWDVFSPSSDSINFHFQNTNLQINLLKKSESRFHAEQVLKESTPYLIKLKNQHASNKNPIQYQIEIIKDQFPEIHLQQYQDTSLFSFIMLGGNISDDYGLSELSLFFKKKENNALDFQSVSIKINEKTASQSFYYNLHLDSLEISEGDKLEYYLEVKDNDGVNGRKSTKTAVYTFAIPSKKEIKEQIKKSESATKSQIDKSVNKSKNLDKLIQELQERLKGKKELNWQDEKLLQDLLNKKEELNKEIEKLQELNKEQNLKDNAFNERSEQIKEKAEQLQKLMNELLDEETKKLYEELQKLMQEKADIEQIQQQLEKISHKEENLEKELERSLELFKKMKMENQLEKNIENLDNLIKKQEELSQKTEKSNKEEQKELQNKQEEIEEEFKEFQDELDQTEQLNQDLKNPEPWQDTKDEEEKISEELKKSSESLEKNKKKDAQKAQKSSSSQMQDLKDKLNQMQEGGEMESMQENLDHLREIMDDLIKLSFSQENLMNAFREVNNSDPRFVDLSKEQLKLKDDSQIIKDSLYALANRVMQIQSFVTREVSSMHQNMDESSEAIKERNKSKILGKQQFAMTSINNLALMLDDVLDQMQQQMAEAQGKPQSGKKSKQKAPSMSQLQQQLNQQIQQLQKSGKTGKQLSEELSKLAAEQEKIRQMLQEMSEKEGGTKPGSNQQLQKQMEQTETDLVNKRLTSETLKRQQEILTRLLETENAQKERELDEERKGQSAQDKEKQLPKGFEEYINQRKKEVELLKSVPPKLTPYYKNEVNNYFKRIRE